MHANFERAVWATRCHPKIRSWKFTLLNLCHHANAEGVAFPGISTIVSETGYSEKAVVDALAGLESMGIIRAKGRCGQHNRVTVYDVNGVSTNVDNLANPELSSVSKDFNTELSSVNTELSSEKGPLNTELSSVNTELSSTRSIIGSNKLVSKLVSSGGNTELTSASVDNSKNEGQKKTPGEAQKAGRNHSAEGSPQPHGPRPRQEGKEAGAAAPTLAELVKTPEWKPRTNQDRRYCMYLCYSLGASRAEAEEFVRYNAIRRWTCCACSGTVNDAAKAWVANWRERSPDEYMAERDRRKAADASKTLS